MTWAHKGDKVRFLARGGYDSELNRAKAVLKPGAELTVEKVEIGNSTSNYTFKEMIGQWNTVMFELVPTIEPKKLVWIDTGDSHLRADTEFGPYCVTPVGWYFKTSDDFVKTSFPQYECQGDYDRRVKEAHMKAQAAKSGLGHNDIWMTLCEIMGDKTPFLPEWAMMELNKRVNDKYFGGSLPKDSKTIDDLEERINELERYSENLNVDKTELEGLLDVLIEKAYDGDGASYVIRNYPDTCADIIKKRREKAISPGLYTINFKNGISTNCAIGIDAEGRNWFASPLFSKPSLYAPEEVSSIHCLDERITPA